MTPTELHRAAMALADEAVPLHNAAVERFGEAFDLERAAALATEVEPSRGILHRSAAWLGVSALWYAEAVEVAERGLAGPAVPEGVAAELRVVLAEALRLRGPL